MYSLKRSLLANSSSSSLGRSSSTTTAVLPLTMRRMASRLWSSTSTSSSSSTTSTSTTTSHSQYHRTGRYQRNVIPLPRTDVPIRKRPTDLLPTRHSRNMLAPTCLNENELQQWTHELLSPSTTLGSLFCYKHDHSFYVSSTSGKTKRRTIKRQQEQAWKAADHRIQQAECVIRGHAARIPGTMWHRWWLLEDDNEENHEYENENYNTQEENKQGETTTTRRNKKRTTTLTTEEPTIAKMNEEGVVTSQQQQQQSPEYHIQTIIAIIDRLLQEGKLYMKMRKERLQQFDKTNATDNNQKDNNDDDDNQLPATDVDFLDWRERPSLGMNKSSTTANNTGITTEDSAKQEDDNDNEEDQGPVYQDATMDEDELREYEQQLKTRFPFASPGPTTAMLDTLMDCLAVAAAAATSTTSSSSLQEEEFQITPQLAAEVATVLFDRHMVDGGDEENTNPHTVPTLISYNAFLRIMANLPYNNNNNNSNSSEATATDATTAATNNTADASSTTTTSNNNKLRDEALYYSFGMYDTLRHDIIRYRNSATMTYMLQVVAKYFPPSRTRGNVAHGLWMHAVRNGVVDINVMEALRAAHTPSNGMEFEEWKHAYLNGKRVGDLPQKLYKYAKVRRNYPREPTY